LRAVAKDKCLDDVEVIISIIEDILSNSDTSTTLDNTIKPSGLMNRKHIKRKYPDIKSSFLGTTTIANRNKRKLDSNNSPSKINHTSNGSLSNGTISHEPNSHDDSNHHIQMSYGKILSQLNVSIFNQNHKKISKENLDFIKNKIRKRNDFEIKRKQDEELSRQENQRIIAETNSYRFDNKKRALLETNISSVSHRSDNRIKSSVSHNINKASTNQDTVSKTIKDELEQLIEETVPIIEADPISNPAYKIISQADNTLNEYHKSKQGLPSNGSSASLSSATSVTQSQKSTVLYKIE
jgi:hypothetical protein